MRRRAPEQVVDQSQAICNYEGTSYRTRFWEGQGRDYENLAERIALQRFLPPQGERLVEIGAGFGRLADLYSGYRQVVLLDYAKSGLIEAQERLGRDGRFIYVAANIYHLPLAPGSIDTALTVRVLHHVSDIPAALSQIAATLRPEGSFILEFANKRHIRAIARYLLRRQGWSPFAPEPYEFVALNYDFHPTWMEEQLGRAGFQVDGALAVSHFRHPAIKRIVPAPALARLDGLLQVPGAALKLAPSVFFSTHLRKPSVKASSALFRCPACGSIAVDLEDEALQCEGCRRTWPCDDGIYDLRWPREAE
jgi:SAM-dependent methyltransferase